MSWIIQHLLMQSEVIKVKADFESDEFNDLLIVEKKISDLRKRNSFSELELKILSLITSGKLFDDISKDLKIIRSTISKTFIETCNKIAFSIGGRFTDEGYLDCLQKTFKLSDEDIDKVINYIHSAYKHKIMRRIKK